MPVGEFSQKGYVTFIANEAITANVFVDLDSDMEVNLADSGDDPIGIAMEAGSAGDPIPVALCNSGIVAKLYVDGSSTAVTKAGDFLKPGAANDGYGIKTTSSGENYYARSLGAAAADDTLIDVLLTSGQVE